VKKLVCNCEVSQGKIFLYNYYNRYNNQKLKPFMEGFRFFPLSEFLVGKKKRGCFRRLFEAHFIKIGI